MVIVVEWYQLKLVLIFIFKVNFPTLDQKIIAIQAPRENMFDGFWQLAIEQNVGLIGNYKTTYIYG